MEAWEFGRALRRWRDAVAPETVGLPVGARRRAAGLRREELAGLAGISADYLTRLEQGRATTPSAQVVGALARALRLGDAERALAFRLAGYAAPANDLVPSSIPPSVQRLLDRFAGIPAAVYDAAGTLLVANAPYDALLGETASWRGLERNAVWRRFTGRPNRTVHSPAETADLESSQVADLRLSAARYPADPFLRRLVRELRARSTRFAELWESELFQPRTDLTRRKTIDHPEVGPISLDCDVLVVSTDDLRILVYTAVPGTEDAERLALAIVLGTQTLVD